MFPPRCLICDGLLSPEEKESGIHNACRGKLYPVTGAVCVHCGRPIDNDSAEYCHDCRRMMRLVGYESPSRENVLTQGKALFLYQGPIKETMYRFKYSNRREYAEFFAEYASAQYGDWIRSKGIEVIVPVPMYRRKERLRGYNQAETFARALSEVTGIPVDTGLVRRIKDTQPQKELSDLERKKNLKSAFQPTENIVQYRQILVVDDIYTTGSTAEAVAQVLKKDETCRIYMMSICIGRGM